MPNQSANSYGILPPYGNGPANYSPHSNIDLMKSYEAPYPGGFHSAPLYPSYESLPPPPPSVPLPPPSSLSAMSSTPQSHLLAIKSESDDQHEAIDSRYGEQMKHGEHSPMGSDRSDSNHSLRIDEPKTMENVTNLVDTDARHDKLKQSADTMFHNIKTEQSSEYSIPLRILKRQSL